MRIIVSNWRVSSHAARPHRRLALAVVGRLVLSGCSGGGERRERGDRRGPATRRPAPARSSTSSCRWASGATSSSSSAATAPTVTTIVTGASIDPHDFEPGTADLAAFTGADLVVLNGAGYDSWAENVVDTLDDEPVVVSAAEVAGVAAGEDPHLWYDPAVVEQMSGGDHRGARAALPRRRGPTSPTGQPPGTPSCSPTGTRSSSSGAVAARPDVRGDRDRVRPDGRGGRPDRPDPGGLPPRREQRGRAHARRPGRVRGRRWPAARSTC